MSDPFELIGAETKFEGRIIRVGVERYRHADGGEVSREKVWHPGAVGDPRLRHDARVADPPAP